MKANHESSAILSTAFEDGAQAFFNQGTNERWRDALTEMQLQRHEDLVR